MKAVKISHGKKKRTLEIFLKVLNTRTNDHAEMRDA